MRLAATWLAGINRMPWETFGFWNALGGIAWATSVGLAAYLAGPVAERVFKAVGLGGWPWWRCLSSATSRGAGTGPARSPERTPSSGGHVRRP